MFVVCALYLLFTGIVDQTYLARLPETPDSSLNRTNRLLLSHGFVRYGSPHQQELLESLRRFEGLAMAGLGGAMLLFFLFGLTRGPRTPA